jgi:hypothetical protein
MQLVFDEQLKTGFEDKYKNTNPFPSLRFLYFAGTRSIL